MKWLTMTILPVFLICLCIICHKSRVSCNVSRLNMFPTYVMQTNSIVKDNGSVQTLFKDQHAVKSGWNFENPLINKSLIIWIL
jgi:hypothetical protein